MLRHFHEQTVNLEEANPGLLRVVDETGNCPSALVGWGSPSRQRLTRVLLRRIRSHSTAILRTQPCWRHPHGFPADALSSTGTGLVSGNVAGLKPGERMFGARALGPQGLQRNVLAKAWWSSAVAFNSSWKPRSNSFFGHISLQATASKRDT